MGLPMSGNLVKKGFVVKAYDIIPANLEKCAEFGVKPATSVAEVSTDVRQSPLNNLATRLTTS
jgi:3-hydroxyisobutyrate dehydrogenase-like beta-hydroxyacid dehydrogenase